MKKTVKSLIIAASVAAIAGIGAVSFAAWEPSANGSVDAPGAAGTVAGRGIAIKTNNLAADENNVLVPYDQDLNNYPLTTAGKTAVKVWEIELLPDATIDTEAGYTVTVTLHDDNALVNGKLYVNNATLADGATDLEGWNEIDTDGYSIAPTSNKIYVVLESELPADESDPNDMGKNLKITITLDEVTD